MKSRYFVVSIIAFYALLFSCGVKPDEPKSKSSALVGTWKLVSGTLIEKGDTTITYYDKELSFIKIINDSHFAFLMHNVNKSDSVPTFSSGGGKYELMDSAYIEHLEYCTDRQWEGHDFAFTVTIEGDTLIQRGTEKIESAGVDRLNIEKYFRLKQ